MNEVTGVDMLLHWNPHDSHIMAWDLPKYTNYWIMSHCKKDVSSVYNVEIQYSTILSPDTKILDTKIL